MRPHRRHRSTRLVAGSALGLLVAASACHPVPVPAAPDLVVVVMDTVRRDRLGVYGNASGLTPRLDALARTATVYDEAYSTSSWTSPAHASLFTGLHPIAHGTTQERWVLREDLVTLAEVLSGAGYETVGIVENPMLDAGYGFDQGFGRWVETWKQVQGASGENPAVRAFRDTLRERDPARPLFLFVNLIEAHSPYDSSGPYRPAEGDVPAASAANEWRDYYRGRRTLGEADFARLRTLYDAEIRRVDDLVGQMIDALERAGSWSRTAFVATADHGENLGEHGHVDHVFSLYETTIRVPLIVYHPPEFAAGARDATPAQLTDLFPTLLRIAGVDRAALAFQGVDLRDVDARVGRPVITEYGRPRQAFLSLEMTDDERASMRQRHWRKLEAIRVGPAKLIWASDGKRELYDLVHDPSESNDLIDAPEAALVRAGLLRMLRAEIQKRAPGAEAASGEADVPVDDRTREELRALGYAP